MEEKFELFHETLTRLGQRGILSDLIIIGSWCLFFYRIKFNNAEEIPAVRTTDLDILIPNPPKIKNRVNIPEILKELGFLEEYSHLTGNSKFVHPDLEIEFLIPEKGRGMNGFHHIKEININAQGIRYVNLLQDHTINVPYKEFTVTIPKPAAFVLNKLHISYKRSKEDKKKKDIETAIEFGEFLLSIEEQAIEIRNIFNSLPGKWQKEIKNIAKMYSNMIFEVLK